MAVIDQKITDEYAVYNGDCVDVIERLADESVHFSLFSPPFCGLYNYSSSERDMSNCRNYDQFFEQYNYLARQLARVTMPGRICAVHCMDIPIPGQKDGYFDFPGDLVKCHVDAGFNYFGRIIIWKEPFRVALRTRLKSLMHRQLVKDSASSTVAAGDVVIVMKRRGTNQVPVSHPTGLMEYAGANEMPEEFMKTKGHAKQELNRFSQWIWRQYASNVWMDIRPERVLPHMKSKDPEDERHVHPLQLDVIDRCINLWSNPGETVLTPFMGVGSEVYGAVVNGRRGVGIELKPSYYKQAVKNLARAAEHKEESSQGLFTEEHEECPVE